MPLYPVTLRPMNHLVAFLVTLMCFISAQGCKDSSDKTVIQPPSTQQAPDDDYIFDLPQGWDIDRDNWSARSVGGVNLQLNRMWQPGDPKPDVKKLAEQDYKDAQDFCVSSQCKHKPEYQETTFGGIKAYAITAADELFAPDAPGGPFYGSDIYFEKLGQVFMIEIGNRADRQQDALNMLVKTLRKK